MSRSIRRGIILFRNDVETITRETLYRGFFSLDLYRFHHRLSNGGMSGGVTREISERGYATVLLPFNPVRDEMVLIKQIRITAYNTSGSPWLFEVVVSTIEAGETVEDVARWETLEEAGPEVEQTKPVLSYLASPGGASERLSILVGEVDASTAKGIHGLAKENEDIRVYMMNREQVYQWVEKEKIDNAASAVALQWL